MNIQAHKATIGKLVVNNANSAKTLDKQYEQKPIFSFWKGNCLHCHGSTLELKLKLKCFFHLTHS